MAMIEDHPLRYQLANELHARPFPALEVPSFAAFLALKEPKDAAGRDRARDRAHLIALLDRFGAPHPPPDATHYWGQIGRHWLKWESHTEFVTYTLFGEGNAERPFDPAVFELFPDDWLADAPGKRIASSLVRVEARPEDQVIAEKLDAWFVAESLAAVEVLDGTAVLATDFRIDAAGNERVAIFADPDMSPRRVGRLVQRVCEIEVYKTMAMLGYARARDIQPRVGALEDELARLVQQMGQGLRPPEATLAELLALSGEVAGITAQTSFRFGATEAYAALVSQRIKVLRERRWQGRQTLNEFMTRRFDPAMRTVRAIARQLEAMAGLGARAADLLRTQVDVARSEEYQALLASMDRRAELQLRLQETVEGLSVVAISYYAVSLGTYALAPLAKEAGIDKSWVAAGLVVPVVLGVWAMVRRIRRHVGHK